MHAEVLNDRREAPRSAAPDEAGLLECRPRRGSRKRHDHVPCLGEGESAAPACAIRERDGVGLRASALPRSVRVLVLAPGAKVLELSLRRPLEQGRVVRRENGSVYHTYTVMAPDPFVAPYHSFLLKRTPKPEPEEARAWRKDEYPD